MIRKSQFGLNAGELIIVPITMQSRAAGIARGPGWATADRGHEMPFRARILASGPHATASSPIAPLPAAGVGSGFQLALR